MSAVTSFWTQTSLQNCKTFHFALHNQSLTSLHSLTQLVTEMPFI